MTARLIHLNGPPAVGKSALARRYGEDHPLTLVCDIDVLRTMVAGWRDDPGPAAELIRTASLAAITAYLRTDHDVVVPQLVARSDQLARFRRAATEGGATYVGIVVEAEPDAVVERFRSRAAASPGDPWIQSVSGVIDDLGGDEAIRRSCRDLSRLAESEGLVRVASSDPGSTYSALLTALSSS